MPEVLQVPSEDLDIPTKQIGTDVYGLPVNLPLLGAGTWQYNNTIAYQSLCKSFDAGYTLVDTAFGYGNERGVGKAIKECYKGKRSNLFVLTKIPGGLSREETISAHRDNMRQLDLEYVDHLMLHFPSDWEMQFASKLIRQAQWQALEEIYYSGKARSIGVSHYCKAHIQDLLEIVTVPISINQVEYHVGSGDIDDVRTLCRQHNITFMSFSPLCGPCQLNSPTESLLTGDLVTSIASNYTNVTGAQVSLRFIVQQALTDEGSEMGAVIPKSNNMQHILENRDIFQFELKENDMQALFQAIEPAAEAGDCQVP